MKLSLILLATFVALATADSSFFRKQADGTFLDKQQKVLRLLVGLGADFKTYEKHEHVPFPYNKPDLYKKPEVSESFMKVYERGMLDRTGVFTFFCHKIRFDTFKLFDLFYYAKDFDTFYDVAYWAKKELNPIQWSYAFITAVFHREDTRGLYVPPLYEVLPHYFVQNEVMTQATNAKLYGETYAKFDVNNTGWEWSWHADMLTGPYKSSPKWVGDDVENRVSYFREDVGLSSYLTYFNMKFASWLTTAKYPDIHFYRRGEIFYGFYNWLKNRYNLERMANGLTPVVPFETFEKLPGYNPHLQDNFGRNYLPRQDKLSADEVNSEGAWELHQVLSRLSDVVDSGVVWESGPSGQFKKLYSKDINGLDEFAKIIYSTSDSISSKYYRMPFYQYIGTINDMVKAQNDRDFTTTVMGSTTTRARDPAFYMVLASLDQWFEKFFKHYNAYTREELSFTGVSVEKFELDRLDTYFERYDWEVTNGITFGDEGRKSKKFEASQFRINHKPYSYKLFVKSDKEVDAIVRVFLAPKFDVDGREYSYEQQRKAMVSFDTFRTKVKSGENVFERHSHQNVYFQDYPKYRNYYEKVNKSLETKEPFYYNEAWHCGAPQNLMVPKGTKSGKEYSVFAIITKYEKPTTTDSYYYPCHHDYAFDQHSLHFPGDRYIHQEDYDLSNIYHTTVKIFHDYSSL